MKLLNLKLDWMKNWSNNPDLYLTVDEIPHVEGMIFTRKGDLYWAEEDGFVKFYSHNFRNQTGYGGKEFILKMETEEIVSLKGPWSSRSGIMNRYFPECVEVIINGISGCVLVSWMKENLSVVDIEVDGHETGKLIMDKIDMFGEYSYKFGLEINNERIFK